jgi:uncharacterized protein (TIGR03437 family)
LGSVQDVAADSKGNIYVADISNSLILKISPDGTLSVFAGNGTSFYSGDGGPATGAGLDITFGIAADNAGNVYVASPAASRVRKISNGIISTVAGNGTHGFSGDGGLATTASLDFPSHLTFDSAGNLYIADTDNGRIRKVSNGIITTVAGNGSRSSSGDGGAATSAGIAVEGAIAFDSADNLYVLDSNGSVRKVSNAIISTVSGSQLNGFGRAQWLALDAAGSIYVPDQVSSRILRLSNGVVTTFAGTGLVGFGGDGGPAAGAQFNLPAGLAFDPGGNLYVADSGNKRIRRIISGTVSTFAGNGAFSFSGDGGPASSANLSQPQGVVVDPSGNLYIADTGNYRIRKISNGNITTIAGNGTYGFTLDGAQATSTALGVSNGVAVDGAGNVFIAGNSVLKVSGGVVTRFAGGGFDLGDGVPARNASLIAAALAVDNTGNVYISDTLNNEIRKVSNGIITTVAGNGSRGFSGDGGPATAAALYNPRGIALDPAGNLYVADEGNSRIRKVSNGIITTVAGSDAATGGDGGPATSAGVFAPTGVALDASGNLYISQIFSLVRKVSNGIITTVAGNGTSGFSGDGGPALNASFNDLTSIAVDAAGNVYVADGANNRVRKILADKPMFQSTPAVLSLFAMQGAATALGNLSVTTSLPGLTYSVSTSTSWLTVSPPAVGQQLLPASLQVVADPSQLSAGNYAGAVTITVPDAFPSTQTITVNFTVSSPINARLTASNASIGFSFTQGASASTQQITISNAGSGSIRFTATATPANLLTVTSSSGSASASSPAAVTVTATPGSLTAGTYSGTITIGSPDTGQQIAIPVSIAISSPPQKILLSQAGFSFTAVALGGSVLPQQLGILNSGSGVLNYNVQASTQGQQSGWLSVSATSGTVTRPFLDVSFVDVKVDARSLGPGTYYGQIQVTASGTSNSPQTAVVVLTVLQAGSTPPPDVRPTGLVFTGTGTSSPSSQNIVVANVSAGAIHYGSSVSYLGAKDWITYKPSDAAVSPDAPVSIVVQPNFQSLDVGTHYATLILTFDGGVYQAVTVLAVVAPTAASPAASKAALDDAVQGASSVCPTKLVPQFGQVGFGGTVTGGYPSAVIVKVVDDCGDTITDGLVEVSFSNGDDPLSLVSLQDGNWTATWVPSHYSSVVKLTAVARQLSRNLTGSVDSSTSLQQASQSPPMLSQAPLGVASLAGDKFAPGDLVLLKGSGLASGTASSTAGSLKEQLAGTSVLIGGRLASLLYADTGQVIGLVPPDVPVNTSQQLLIERDNALGTLVPVIIAPTHPSVLTRDGSGQGQGLIYKGGSLADSSNPVKAGDTIVIYCTGLGATDANGAATNAPTVSLGGQVAQITYAGVALPAGYPQSGAPTLLGVVSSSLGGLYEITAKVPNGIASGSAGVTLSSAGQTSQAGVTVTIGGGVAPIGPAISSVNTAGGFPDVAQNDFIEIKGSNLASSTGFWDSAAIQASGRLPTQTAGVSVTVNGKAAFVYYVSPTQLNVLTPLDNTTGPVQIVATNNGVAGPAFTASMRATAPSFLMFNPTNYVAATHADQTLFVGPTSMSAPGYPFFPAKSGETIVLYAVGLGLPKTMLVNGSSAQFGELPTPYPVVQIGGQNANVSFAGVVSPGLYQLNVTLPSGTPVGDDSITVSYGGQTSSAGALLSVQK